MPRVYPSGRPVLHQPHKWSRLWLQLAIAFTIGHPGVTSSIIGPRTMEQLTSQLPAVDVELPDDVLDAIDAIVPPGTNIRADDAGYAPPAIADAALRRR